MATQVLHITLPEELANKVRAEVECGRYSSESAVVEESLAGMLLRNDEVEHWLRTEVVAAYDELMVNPDSAVTLDHLQVRLDAEHARRTSAL